LMPGSVNSLDAFRERQLDFCMLWKRAFPGEKWLYVMQCCRNCNLKNLNRVRFEMTASWFNSFKFIFWICRNFGLR
jgi:hypothetical protein